MREQLAALHIILVYVYAENTQKDLYIFTQKVLCALL